MEMIRFLRLCRVRAIVLASQTVDADRSNMNEFHVLLSFCVPRSKLWSVNGDHCQSGYIHGGMGLRLGGTGATEAF